MMTETRSAALKPAPAIYPTRTLGAAMYQAVCHYGTPAWATKNAFAAAIRTTLSANDINSSLNNIAGTSGGRGRRSLVATATPC